LNRLHVRILDRIAHLACYRYRLVLGVALTLTLLSVLPPMLIGMRFAFDISKMLPQEIPAARWDHRPGSTRWTRASLTALRTHGRVLTEGEPIESIGSLLQLDPEGVLLLLLAGMGLAGVGLHLLLLIRVVRAARHANR